MRTIITSMYTYMYLTVMIICILVCLPSVIYSIYILVMIIVYYLVMIFIDKAQCKKNIMFLMRLRLYTHLAVVDLKYQFYLD